MAESIARSNDNKTAFASLSLQAGASPVYVQRQLCHQDIRLTVNHYGKWLQIHGGGAGGPLERLLSDRVVASGDQSVLESDEESSQVAVGIGGPQGDRTPTS
jgi:hypothetical protein